MMVSVSVHQITKLLFALNKAMIKVELRRRIITLLYIQNGVGTINNMKSARILPSYFSKF